MMTSRFVETFFQLEKRPRAGALHNLRTPLASWTAVALDRFSAARARPKGMESSPSPGERAGVRAKFSANFLTNEHHSVEPLASLAPSCDLELTRELVSELFPDPEAPVTHTRTPSGISTS